MKMKWNFWHENGKIFHTEKSLRNEKITVYKSDENPWKIFNGKEEPQIYINIHTYSKEKKYFS